MNIGGKDIGGPCYIIAEIGINHNGDLDTALRLIDAAVLAGADAVKFQKRTPEICTPKELWDKMRDTPWGYIPYIQYRRIMEFGHDEYRIIDEYCQQRGIHWFASAWDVPSVSFLEDFDPIAHKIASAMLTNDAVLDAVARTGRPTILSTGMSTYDDIDFALSAFKQDVALMHCVSKYPCEDKYLNLRMIHELRIKYDLPVGYSGHEVGLATTVAAVVMGASMIERHITLDRAMWGSDQAASVEPHGFAKLVRDIRSVEEAMGDGVKRVLDAEIEAAEKLRYHDI